MQLGVTSTGRFASEVTGVEVVQSAGLNSPFGVTWREGGDSKRPHPTQVL